MGTVIKFPCALSATPPAAPEAPAPAASSSSAAVAASPAPEPPKRKVTVEALPELVDDLRAAHRTALFETMMVKAAVGFGMGVAYATGRGALPTDENVHCLADRGTSNFDAAVLACEKREAKLVEAACKIAGGSCYEWKLFRKFAGMVIGGFGAPGQGTLRSKYAERFEKAMAAKGWPMSMYYQCD